MNPVRRTLLSLSIVLAPAVPCLGAVQTSEGFRFVDDRPIEALKGRMMSKLITGCSFGVQTLGDFGSGEESPRLMRLRGQLIDRFGAKLDGHELRIQRYQLAVSFRKNMTRTALAAAMGGGALSAGLAGNGAKPPCGHDRMKAGWFDPADLDYETSPIVVEIEALVDGKQVHIDAARSERRAFLDLKPNEREEADRMMNAALDKANARFMDAVAAQLS